MSLPTARRCGFFVALLLGTGAARADVTDNLHADDAVFDLVSEKGTLSLHKPMFVLLPTYSPEYASERAEVLFQVSLKQQLFKSRLWFAYSQRSFWQILNGAESRPFRGTDYNPELFWRAKSPDEPWGVDLGFFEHESNGRPLPESRSWNRSYLAAWRETGDTLVHLKGWIRWSEDPPAAPLDPAGDDNPDIHRYYGYGELRFQQKFQDGATRINLFLRGNPATGYGAVSAQASWSMWGELPVMLYAWHGYGESLLDYDRSVTRIGVGVALAR